MSGTGFSLPNERRERENESVCEIISLSLSFGLRSPSASSRGLAFCWQRQPVARCALQSSRSWKLEQIIDGQPSRTDRQTDRQTDAHTAEKEAFVCCCGCCCCGPSDSVLAGGPPRHFWRSANNVYLHRSLSLSHSVASLPPAPAIVKLDINATVAAAAMLSLAARTTRPLSSNGQPPTKQCRHR